MYVSLLFQKARYQEDDLPPTPSPPQIVRENNLDGISKQGSLERINKRKTSEDREQIIKENYKSVSNAVTCYRYILIFVYCSKLNVYIYRFINSI